MKQATNHTDRRRFLRNTGIIAATVLMPVKLLAKQVKTIALSIDPPAFNPYALIDLHCHPSLKMFLLGKKFYRRHWLRSAHPGENIFHQQEDTHEFESGNVRGILATHYLVEKDVRKEWTLIKILWGFFVLVSEIKKIELESDKNADQICAMMDKLEEQLKETNSRGSRFTYKVVFNFKQFSNILDNEPGTIPVIHAIEGAHALGRNLAISEEAVKEKTKIARTQAIPQNIALTKALLPNEGHMASTGPDPAEKYKQNLQRVHDRGVCMITLSHFFANDLAFSVEGISPKGKQSVGMKRLYNPATDDIGLTPIGKDVVREMLDMGVIVDLTHTTPQVRKDVFFIRDDVNKQRALQQLPPRPLVFSHVGSQEVFDLHDHGMYPNYKYYNVSPEEIARVCEGGGVIGVIPEIFWLAGSNRAARIPGQPSLDEDLGIPYIIETMKELNRHTPGQDYDHIAIGTDFDGLATNPKDLFLNHQLNTLYDAMKNDPELCKGDRIKKITSLNAKRLLQYGWDGPDHPPIA